MPCPTGCDARLWETSCRKPSTPSTTKPCIAPWISSIPGAWPSIKAALAARERQLFQLQDTIYLYGLTSTYFEGQCPKNPKARYGYSRDHRPDCKQVVVGLVFDGEGFPKAHEVFEGNRADSTTLEEMLAVLEQRTGGQKATVVVDRGLVSEENLQRIRARGHHYLVTARQSERHRHQEEFEDEEGWEEVKRSPSPQNLAQKKSRVFIKPGRSSPGGADSLCE